MSIQFIGVGVSKGTMDGDNGKKFDYDNRLIRCITNEGMNSDDYGFMAMKEVKIKTSVLCQSIGCMPKDLDTYLQSALGQEVEFKYGVIKGVSVVTGLKFSSPTDSKKG